jgi:hypothetical protein
MSERIPIAPGFFIELKNGRAGSRGREESGVLPTVLFWLHKNPEHENCDRVREWVHQKEKQIEEDVREKRINAERDQLNARIDSTARSSNLHDPKTIELIRAEYLKLFGLSVTQD